MSAVRRIPLLGLLSTLLFLSPAPPECSAGPGSPVTARRLLRSVPSDGWSWDTVATELRFDLATWRGTARLSLSPAPTAFPTVWLAVGDLTVERVEGPAGPLPFRVSSDPEVGRRLEVTVPGTGTLPVTLEVGYRFQTHDRFDGFLSTSVTFLWPYHCGNLFPCDPDPADGFRFHLSVEGVPEDDVLVAPEEIPGDGPPYMPAFAVGDYTWHRLGTTEAGTEVGVWTLPGNEGAALLGAADLVEVFDWFERTYGPYLFGDRVASVIVDWPTSGFGGMEHHPFWHIARRSAGDRVTHAHEAAHGWFGNGVRLRCWEDFVLSEGVATYLAARALEAVRGAAQGKEIWRRYRRQLIEEVAEADTEAWPTTCDEIDILRDPLWSSIPYLKGAFFLRAVEGEVGRPALDRTLAAFYREHAGRAAGMAELLSTLRRETGFDPGALAESWLRGLGIPED
jgi:hypothetical protein